MGIVSSSWTNSFTQVSATQLVSPPTPSSNSEELRMIHSIVLHQEEVSIIISSLLFIMRTMMPNAHARLLLDEGNAACSDNNMQAAEEKWTQCVREACSPSQFDPGVIFLGNYRLAKYYASQEKEIQCNVSIQQALSASINVFTEDDCPPSIQSMMNFLKDLRDGKKRKSVRQRPIKYTRSELMIIRNTISGLSHRRPNDLYGEVITTKNRAKRAYGTSTSSRPTGSSGSRLERGVNTAPTRRNETTQAAEPSARTPDDSPVATNRVLNADPREGVASLDAWGVALESSIACALGDGHVVVQADNGDGTLDEIDAS